jgi:hypothetical protein
MARRDVEDELRHDVLVEIPKGQERRFGTGGKMLKPSRASIEAEIAKVPRDDDDYRTAPATGTTARRRHSLPVMTKRALMAIAEDAAVTAPIGASGRIPPTRNERLNAKDRVVLCFASSRFPMAIRQSSQWEWWT